MRNVGTSHHVSGTCKMGPASDPMAVVDQYCRVRGVEDLRVVDASVMPNIPSANTNMPCIMIGEHVADWMRAEAPGSSGRQLASARGHSASVIGTGTGAFQTIADAAGEGYGASGSGVNGSTWPSK